MNGSEKRPRDDDDSEDDDKPFLAPKSQRRMVVPGEQCPFLDTISRQVRDHTAYRPHVVVGPVSGGWLITATVAGVSYAPEEQPFHGHAVRSPAKNALKRHAESGLRLREVLQRISEPSKRVRVPGLWQLLPGQRAWHARAHALRRGRAPPVHQHREWTSVLYP